MRLVSLGLQPRNTLSLMHTRSKLAVVSLNLQPLRWWAWVGLFASSGEREKRESVASKKASFRRLRKVMIPRGFRGSRSAFTLIELLITVGIVLVLAALVVPSSLGILDKARAAQEMGGARKTITAWLTYAAENDGRLLTGYLPSGDPELDSVKKANDTPLANKTEGRRYVYRLAPYLNYELKGSVLLGKQANLTDEYSVSVTPSLGLNTTFLGGDYAISTDLSPASYPQYVTKKLVQLAKPAQMIVFGSARFDDPTKGMVEGYNAIKPPAVFGQKWVSTEQYVEKSPYMDYGALHLRYDKRAVCAMADGHIELLDIKQLSDMRRWSNDAALADNPYWVATP